MIQFDCHAHIYEHITAVSGARYVPNAPATLALWSQSLKKHGLKGGVIVQVSFLGTDNSQLCAALAKLDSTNFAGVAVVSPTIDEQEIDCLYAAGVRGFRWNLVRGASLPALNNTQVRDFLSSIYKRGMHIELHLESPRLAEYIGPLLDVGGTVVVDHLGLPSEPNPADDPWLKAIANQKNLSGLYVKFSASYRTPFDTLPHAETLQKLLLPDHIVWGSDWPHTQHESTVDYSSVAIHKSTLPIESDSRAVQALYGLQ